MHPLWRWERLRGADIIKCDKHLVHVLATEACHNPSICHDVTRSRIHIPLCRWKLFSGRRTCDGLTRVQREPDIR